MARVVLGVGGGIAAYKAAELLRRLTESGHGVRVVPTAAALHFVGAATWEALSGEPATPSVWNGVTAVDHVRLGQQADLVVVAPATADLLARAAHGLADDLLTSVLLTARGPVLMAPAMHTEMWQHAATVANVATLRSRGVEVMDPAVGRLTGVDSGPGRLPEPDVIAARCAELLAGAGARSGDDLAGRRVVVSAGGTREPLDPVRFLGNRSSGRQGLALVEAALARGADVVLVAANLALPAPPGVHVERVQTAEQLRRAVSAEARSADVVVMAAAVADYRPAATEATKIKKDGQPLTVTFEPTADVLAELVASRRPGQVVVGFAAETGDAEADWREHGRRKLARKQCDVLVVNEVGEGLAFGTPDNAVVILRQTAGGVGEQEVGRTSKRAVADAVWDTVAPLLPDVPHPDAG
jgi:phosphopantothenoylcysteine decarboxylase/phosphopantothenate--cysteine ligase